MDLWNLFRLGYTLVSNPNRTYRKGWEDALAGNPKYQFRLAFLFKHFREMQELYNEGYKDGQRERLIRKI